MDISFTNQKLQKVFNSGKNLIREYGENAKVITRRMAVLHAAYCLADVPHLPPEKCHQLSGNRKDHFAVYLKHPFRLVFVPNHDPIPRKDDGGIELNQVTAITIIGVEDYH